MEVVVVGCQVSLQIKILTDKTAVLNTLRNPYINYNIKIVYLRNGDFLFGWKLCHNYDQDGNHNQKHLGEKTLLYLSPL